MRKKYIGKQNEKFLLLMFFVCISYDVCVCVCENECVKAGENV